MTALKRPDLLPILVCPETHQPLAVADAPALERLNEQLAAGRCRNRAGQTVREPLAGALVRIDGHIAYPVRNGVPLLLLDEQVVIG